ncbi:unnamed protein product [Closterium sp. NIES-53]
MQPVRRQLRHRDDRPQGHDLRRGHCRLCRAGMQVGAEDSPSVGRPTEDISHRRDKQHPVAVLLQLHAVLLQLTGRKQVRSHARDIEHIRDEYLLPGLPLQSDGAAALDVLHCPIEAAHVLDVAARL